MAVIKISDYKPLPPIIKITIGKNSTIAKVKNTSQIFK